MSAPDPASGNVEEFGVDVAMQRNMEAMMGRQYKLVWLTSERGQSLNGQIGTCVGCDPAKPDGTAGDRVQIKLDTTGEVLRLQPKNLLETVVAQEGSVPSSEMFSEELSLKAIDVALKYPPQLERLDQKKRLEFAKSIVSEGKLKECKCCDMLMQESEIDQHPGLKALSKMAPPCVGQNKVDFKAFGTGLQNAAEEDQLGTYRTRLHEWLVSGLCSPCQKVIFQN
eukprot:GFYU01012673.1.p1 GENE.GFYU01012673.1~~GFYU01012673.1.p1  ORF type:complete len:225 (-),score=23.85 GFYU01012673.1:60-734(-)